MSDDFKALMDRYDDAIARRVISDAHANSLRAEVARWETSSLLKSSVEKEVNEMFRAMLAGEKIHAIKSYRTLTGQTLVVSKDTIDNVMARLKSPAEEADAA